MDRFEGETFHSLLERVGQWGTHFDTKRRYVDHFNFRFWENGVIEALTDFGKQPDDRARLARKTPLQVYSTNEVLPYELYTLEGEKVRKAWLKTCMLMFDMHSKVAVCADPTYGKYPRTYVKWLSREAFPIPSAQIEYTQPDRSAENRMWKEVFDIRWHEARVLRELGEMPPGSGGCDDHELWDPECRVNNVMIYLATFENKQPLIDRHIKPKTNKVVNHDFLRFK